MGGLQGSLSDVSAVELGTTAIKAAVERSGINPDTIDEVFMGNVLSAGLRQAPARQAALHAGVPETAGAVTLNKLCGSGMQAAIYAFDSIAAGNNKAVIAGGMESMSNAPHVVMGARGGVRTGHSQFFDHMFLDGLEDASSSRMMGSFAQDTADAHSVSREDMDNFAIESLTRAQHAINNGTLAEEIAPVVIKTRRGETIVKDDEQPLTAKIDKIPSLRPAFAKDGTLTAANSSSISDGASALVLMSESEAKAQGLTPIAKVVAHARHSQAPKDFTLAPIGAMEKLFAKTGWSQSEVDLYEINEAFAMVTMLAVKHFALDMAKVNVHGGACAQGHPIGSTGSRLIVTLMHELKRQGLKKGMASLCIGAGEATAMAIEIL
jgi:acetyl-CoA C-acetyltransferase